MHTPHFPSVRSSLSQLRTSFRRSPSNASTLSHDSTRHQSPSSSFSSPVGTIMSIMSRQPSMLDLEEERKSFGLGLDVLEPRPVVYWAGLEERMESLESF